MKKRTIINTMVAVGAGLGLAIAVPLAASAHVTISPYSAEPGSYALITFKVPNESAKAVTNKIEVDIPAATPFASVSYIPVPGWKVSMESKTLPKPISIDGGKLTEAVSKITWTADPGSEIADGQLQVFPLSVGPVPDTGKIVMLTTQTYSDGTVVKWDQTGADAEEPAPTLYVNDTPVASHDADAEVTASTIDAAHPSGGASVDVVARGLGIAGLVVGAIGIALAAVVLRRRTAA